MDKMLVAGFGDVTITSDGATVLKEMDIQHPAAKMMVEVSKTTDDEVGDGTTSVVVFAGRLLEKAETLLDQNIHSTIIVDGFKLATDKAIEFLTEAALAVKPEDKAMLKKVAMTTMATKLVSENKELLADLSINAVLKVTQKTKDGYKVDIDDIKVDKKAGESIESTQLIDGIIIDKEVLHSSMPKRIQNAKIALLNTPLEIEKTEMTAKINIEKPEEMKAFLDRAGLVSVANGGLLRGKIGAAVVAVRRGGGTHAFDTINHMFLMSGVIVPGSTYWNLGYGLDKGDVAGDAEGLRNMEDIGKTIAWLGAAMAPHMATYPKAITIEK